MLMDSGKKSNCNKQAAQKNAKKTTTESWIEVFSKKIMIQNTLDLLLKKLFVNGTQQFRLE